MAFRRRFCGLPFSRIKVTDPFWVGYQRRLVEVSLPLQWEQILRTGRLANFLRAAGKESGTHEGIYFNDSDVYKFVEACAYALATGQGSSEKRDVVRAQMNEAIEAVEAAQEPDGYLGTFFQLKHPELKWRNLGAMHEMYCGGHLIEAAVGVYEALGERRLLDVAVRFADHVMSVFGPGRRSGYCGHEEIELALIRLAAATGEQKYQEFARWMVEERGKRPSPFEAELQDAEAMKLSPWVSSLLGKDGIYSGEYAQDHAPIRAHTQIVGHAVRGMYLYMAATELADGQGDTDLETALERIWNNLTRRRMYVTGGIGPSAKNEGFTADYDLPNLTAYAETCAAVGLAFWGRRLLEMTGSSEYADIVERALYNGVLSGISRDGSLYFYDNPLESRGEHSRVPWFHCACCPPNIARLIGSVSSYVASEAEDGFSIHIPVGMVATCRFGEITVESEYPWSGRFKVSMALPSPTRFALRIRIPDWSDEMETDLPDSPDAEEAGYEGGYAVFDRLWQPGDSLTVDLGMAPRWVESDPRVRDNLGRVALTVGPLVYCAEEPDLGFAPQLLSVDTSTELVAERASDLATVMVDGLREIEVASDELYVEDGTVETEEVSARFVPYFSWNNRGAAGMQVWVRRV